MNLPLPTPPVLFAAFGNPLMLWGLAGASLPIIIHLLNRRKFREMQWAAMRFLLAAIRKNQRRVRIEQWLLLAVRTLVLVFLAMAMAKPALESFGALDALSGRRHWVLALDGSLSMDYATGEATHFEQAREIARRLVRDARGGDVFSLVLLSDPPRTIIGAPGPSKSAALKAIDDLRLPHGNLDRAAGFRALDAVLEASDIPRKELVVLTDAQRASWAGRDAAADEPLRQALARLEAKRVRSLVIDLGTADAQNRAVVALDVQPGVVTAGAATAVRAKIQAFGAAFPTGVARLVVDGRLVPDEQQEIPALQAGESAEVQFGHEFAAPGDHVVEVRIDEDPLALDNRRRRVVGVRESVNVLLVDGDPKPGVFESETAFLAEALAPEPESPGEAGPVRVRVISPGQLARTDLSAFDAVALCNVPRVRRDEVEQLEAYLKLGGGLVVFTGDQVQAEETNRLLYADGKGLLPARIAAVIGDPESRDNPFLFDTLGYRHPILAPFLGQPEPVQASLTNVKTFRYHRLEIPKDSPAQVALRLGNDPLIVESARGRGRVVLVGTTADRAWTDWPIHQSYPAVMEGLLFRAAAGRFADRNVPVGRALEELLPANAAGADVSITWPDRDEPVRAAEQRQARGKVEPAGDVARFRFGPTDRSGTYRVEFGPPVGKLARFAANPDPVESDPAKLDAAGLRAALPGWAFDYASDWRPLQRSAASVGQRGELHRPLLWALLVFLIVESIIAWRFGHHARIRA
jgi:hypothetical protein